MKCLILTLPAYGHVNISLGLSKALTALHIEVHAYTSLTFKQSYEDKGATVHLWPLEVEELKTNSIRFIKVAGSLMKYASAVYKDLVDLHKKENFDFLIFDFLCVWGKALAIDRDIPSVHISPTIIMDRTVVGLNWSEIISHFKRPGLSLYYYMRFLKEAKTFQKISKTRWKGWDSLYEVRPSSLSLLFIYKEMQPRFNLINDQHHFLGPSILGRQEHINTIKQWLDGRPLIMVSLGTVFNNNRTFFKKFAQSVKNKPCQMAISKGQDVKEIMESMPENVLTKPSLPQLFILRNSKVFITHGGSNSIMEAIHYQVPMIVIPTMGDHYWMAKLVEELEIGVWLKNFRSIPSSKLWSLIEELSSNPKYRKNLKRITRDLQAQAGSRLGAKAIHDWINRGFDLSDQISTS